jgi:hypothetical protein
MLFKVALDKQNLQIHRLQQFLAGQSLRWWRARVFRGCIHKKDESTLQLDRVEKT